ncbi:MAG TPA: lipopolysaccharide biosynthesis protein, partial [Caulobacteraceae bacterium]|nr:lipopolysaccharide biosynthesis protein [Caulobacteraceae bacterium]
DRIQLTAEIAALKKSSEALEQQADQVTVRQLRLDQLEPQYQGLTRDRDVLQNNVRDFTVKEQESQAADAIARQGNDNISIIERAVVPTQGKSLKMPVVLLAAALGAFTALCVGLLKMFLRPGLATASVAARTLGLPVLAIAGVKSGAWI